MSKGRSFLYRLTDAAQLHDEAIPRLPLVEIMNDQRVLIENHQGVVEYGANQISVRVKFGAVTVCGCNLELARMMKGQLIVTGRIDSVHLLRGKKP